MIIHYFTDRIRVILEQIRRIEAKDYAVSTPVSGRDELARVSQAVNAMAQGMQSAINDVKEKEKQRRHMQLSLLQSQINPHFLYNSLAGVSALALRNGNEEAHRLAGHLAQFYKLSLSRGKDIITLEEEIQIARHYLSATLYLKSHVELYLDAGATLMGSQNFEDYSNQCPNPINLPEIPR